MAYSESLSHDRKRDPALTKDLSAAAVSIPRQQGGTAPPEAAVRAGIIAEHKVMRLVRQKKKTDCGIACLAMLAGISYAQAKRALFGEKHKGPGCSAAYTMASLSPILIATKNSEINYPGSRIASNGMLPNVER
jgi:hypothetical protein